jgi:hypothetical protein
VTHRDLDDAIDWAVREMMSAEPRAGFRGRVLARIDEPRRAWLTVPRLTGATVCAAALVAVLVLDRGQERPARPSAPTVERAAIAENAPGPGTPREPIAGPAPAVVRAPATRPIARGTASSDVRREATPFVQAASIAIDDDMGLPALADLEPLALPDIPETRLMTREISLAALRIAPLTIEPLPQGGTEATSREDR